MTDRDDGEDDDQLRSLRAVWLSLPDEDPPERGLSALMAAARVKAEAMAKPSLWQRFVDLLRRPPVLALASVMVLLGGAVFVLQRRDKLEHVPTVQPPSVESTDQGGSGEQNAPAMAAPEPPKVEIPEGAPAEAAEPDGKNDPFDRKKEPAAQAPAKHSSALKRPAPTRDLAKESAHTKKQDSGRADSLLDKREAESKITSGVVGGDEEEKPKATTTKTGAVSRPESTTVAPAAEAAPPPSPSPPAPSAAQLHAQARSAAARGDCAAVRTVSKRIQNVDARYYRDNVAGDKSLASCIVAQ